MGSGVLGGEGAHAVDVTIYRRMGICEGDCEACGMRHAIRCVNTAGALRCFFLAALWMEGIRAYARHCTVEVC